MTQKKIAINLLNFCDDQIAGAAVFAKNLLNAWFTLSDSLPEIVVFYTAAVDIQKLFGLPNTPHVSYKKVNVDRFWRRIFYEQLILPFALKGYDVYFAPTPVMPFLNRIVNPGVVNIVTIHDMIPFFVPNKYGRIRSIYVKLLSFYSARWAEKVITVSENSKTDIVTITKVDLSRVSVIYNFLPRMYDYGSVKYENFFLSISTIEPGKNIENTMNGFRIFLQKSERDYRFFWIGKIGWGYTASSLKKLVEDLGLEKNFFMVGYVDDARKNELLRNCQAMVYLSHYEGFGLPVLEGLHHYKPCIVSNTSSLPEVVGKAGELCDKDNPDDIADALLRVSDNLDYYIREIPVQLQKFDERTQLHKFLTLMGLNDN